MEFILGVHRDFCAEMPDAFLQDMEREDELRTVPSWKAHQHTGDRKGVWSLFVTKTWRMTFRVDQDEIEIVDLAMRITTRRWP